jgi:hypothetical protein
MSKRLTHIPEFKAWVAMKPISSRMSIDEIAVIIAIRFKKASQ